MKREMWFAVVEDGAEWRHCVETTFAPFEPVNVLGEMREWGDYDQEWAAADAAESYYHNHDGHESKWPLTFALFASEEGPELARVRVECEFEPSFYGRALKPESPTKGQP